MNEELVDLCSDLTPIDGNIVTAAGEVMGIIKFKGSICFMGIRIECLVATINSSIVSSRKTAIENNFSWIFGPGDHASVTSHTNNATVSLKLVDNLYPLPRNLFTANCIPKNVSRVQTTVCSEFQDDADGRENNRCV